MIEETVTVTVVRTVITDIAAARDLQDWCEARPDLYCRITSKVGGGYSIEVGGTTSHERSCVFGDTVVWDGSQFTVTSG